MTPTPLTNEKLRAEIGDIVLAKLPNPATGLYDVKTAIDQLMTLIHEALAAREAAARIDELGGVQLEYGNYIAATWVDGKQMTVEERYKDLQALAALQQSSKDGEKA